VGAALNSVVVVGTGLIGTSIALALRRQEIEVFLQDRDPRIARTAAGLGAGTAGEPPDPVDLTVLAVPPTAVGPVLEQVQRRRLSRAYTIRWPGGNGPGRWPPGPICSRAGPGY
jgi:prephenate dehydrogenase